MLKLIIIIVLISMLIYSIIQKLNILGTEYTSPRISNSSKLIEIGAPLSIYKNAIKATLITVSLGIILLLVTIILTAKFKIALFMLPISFYLIGQYFILNNHIKVAKSQRILYNTDTGEVHVTLETNTAYTFNLQKDIKLIKEVKSVQKNNGILFGYYKIKTQSIIICIPYLVENNLSTQPFFKKIKSFDYQVETKLFPII